MPVVGASLKAKKIDTVIPGGCTKYIQAPDVSWNKPFKAICTEKYDEWLETVGIHQGTDAGNLKPPPRSTIVNWILDSWSELPSKIIRKSFKACALTSATDGSEDKDIHCFIVTRREIVWKQTIAHCFMLLFGLFFDPVHFRVHQNS